MPIILAAIGLFVLIGLGTDRFGARQRALTAAIAVAIPAIYLFTEGLM